MTKQIATTGNDLSDGILPGGMGWKTDLDKTEKGNIIPNLPNARRVVSRHPYLRDCFAWSEFDEDVMLMRPLPGFKNEGLIPPDAHGVYPQRFTDKFHTYLRDVISVAAEANFKSADILAGVQNAALQKTYNPIREYLNSLTWDGISRVDDWLTDGMGAENTDLTSKMGRMFLIAACRRACFRRYKFDSMLILEGKKGIRKSTACRILFGNDYFSEGIGDIRKDECVKNLAGMWGAEIPEGKGFFTASAEEQKEFLSKVEDTYRRAYAVRAITVPRRFVLICTTNSSEYLKETETDRRFWPVLCGVAHEPDVAWLRDNRDQLWAEAYHLANLRDENGKLAEQTYLGAECIEELADLQCSRVIDDPWGNQIRHHLLIEHPDTNEITSMQLLANVLAIPIDRQDRSCATKVGIIMRDMGWRKVRRRVGGETEFIYVR